MVEFVQSQPRYGGLFQSFMGISSNSDRGLSFDRTLVFLSFLDEVMGSLWMHIGVIRYMYCREGVYDWTR